MSNNKVSVIIASSGRNDRVQAIQRAIGSVLSQKQIRCIPIIIANGKEFNPALMDSLSKDKRLRFHYLDNANFPEAILYGRRLVDTEYFCFLDDDDVLLEDSISLRIQKFYKDDHLDVVVGNGYIREGSDSRLVYENKPEIVGMFELDPLYALFGVNWLASCGGLYKSKTIGIPYFEDYVHYYEWTYLAFRLSIEKNIGFIGDPTYIIYKTSGSLSKSDDYIEGQYKLLKKLSKINIAKLKHKRLFNKMYCDSFHSLSDYSRKKGKFGKAIMYHLISLNYVYGFKYVPYSRYIIKDLLDYIRSQN